MKTSITSNTAISTRDSLSKEISKLWNIMRTENVIPKDAKRNFNLKNVYERIQSLSEERMLVKLYLQCINMGFTKFSEMPSDANYFNIFALSEKKEQLWQLSNRMKYIDPKLKRDKGKKGLDMTEELSVSWLNAEKNKLQLEVNKLEKEMLDFNNSAVLDLSEAPMKLTA